MTTVYYTGGAEDQYTLKENVEAFRRITYAVKSVDYFCKLDTSY
jgi:isopentenyl diphosphate isomerase/L-lactate dehydrogenase-like FMN-dependent dehydrogenase